MQLVSMHIVPSNLLLFFTFTLEVSRNDGETRLTKVTELIIIIIDRVKNKIIEMFVLHIFQGLLPKHEWHLQNGNTTGEPPAVVGSGSQSVK